MGYYFYDVTIPQRISVYDNDKCSIYFKPGVRMKEIRVGGEPKKVNTFTTPAKRKSYRRSFLSKMIEVVKDDINYLILRKRAVLEDTPAGWDEYIRFIELSMGKR